MPTEEERWMTLDEVAKYLQLSRAKIYELAQAGKIPCSKVVGRWRFRRNQIDDWMSSHASPRSNRKPNATIERASKGNKT